MSTLPLVGILTAIGRHVQIRLAIFYGSFGPAIGIFDSRPRDGGNSHHAPLPDQTEGENSSCTEWLDVISCRLSPALEHSARRLEVDLGSSEATDVREKVNSVRRCMHG